MSDAHAFTPQQSLEARVKAATENIGALEDCLSGETPVFVTLEPGGAKTELVAEGFKKSPDAWSVTAGFLPRLQNRARRAAEIVTDPSAPLEKKQKAIEQAEDLIRGVQDIVRGKAEVPRPVSELQSTAVLPPVETSMQHKLPPLALPPSVRGVIERIKDDPMRIVIPVLVGVAAACGGLALLRAMTQSQPIPGTGAMDGRPRQTI